MSDAGQLNSSLPSIMLASDGTELARFQVEYRDPVELDQISEYVREGTVLPRTSASTNTAVSTSRASRARCT